MFARDRPTIRNHPAVCGRHPSKEGNRVGATAKFPSLEGWRVSDGLVTPNYKTAAVFRSRFGLFSHIGLYQNVEYAFAVCFQPFRFNGFAAGFAEVEREQVPGVGAFLVKVAA